MFNLCKNVKIYHTVNHYHPDSHPKALSEAHFQEPVDHPGESSPNHPPIRMVESHSTRTRKSRTGINISLKESSTNSPYKNSQHTLDRDLTQSQHNRSSTNSHCRQSEPQIQRLRPFNKIEKCSPLIVESKYTCEQMTPRLAFKENPEIPSPKTEKEVAGLQDMPLKRRITGTTQISSNHNQPKIVVSAPNPLKKSTSFIRSSSKSSINKSLKNSVENSLNNSIDFKFSNYKLKRQEASDSLLRLSCSSYSQIFERPAQNAGYQDFSQSCSLELKREQSCFLNQYACDVNQSIIISKPSDEKTLKIVKSNNDLLSSEDIEDLKQNHSNILERQINSPVQKLKKRYGSNLLHPYDKETIVSKSFTSRSQQNSHFRQIIDESTIIQHQIDNQFIPLKDRQINRPEYRMFLAVQNIAKLLVNIKQLPINHIDKINQELMIYREIQSHKIDVDVSKLYQIFTHGNILVLVKEPYELTLKQFIQKHSQEYVQISWQFVTRSIEESLLKTISTMKKQKMYLNRLISSEDIVYMFGEWKLHSPEMFEAQSREEVEIGQVLAYLRQQIQGRLRSYNHTGTL